jgi:hypothetical protein
MLRVGFWLLVCLVSIGPAQASNLPFKAPQGTTVQDLSSGKDYLLWSIIYPDYTAWATVGKTKLAASYRSSAGFKRYIQSAIGNDRSFQQYGIKTKLTWRKNSYVLSASGPQYRVYLKGRLGSGGFWHFGSMAGYKGASKTAALERMVKALK